MATETTESSTECREGYFITSRCNLCPYYTHSYGQGENLYLCGHGSSPKGYKSVVSTSDALGFPDWCPLDDGPVSIVATDTKASQ